MEKIMDLVTDLVKVECKPVVCLHKQLKKSDNFNLSASTQLDIVDSKNVNIGETALEGSVKGKLFDTKLGPIIFENSAKMSTTAFSSDMTLSVSPSISTEFDAAKAGNFVLTPEKVEYERSQAVYLGGPFGGSGATVKFGGDFTFADKKAGPLVGIDDLKVVKNPATVVAGLLVAVGLVLSKTPVSTGLSVPIPGDQAKAHNGKAKLKVGLKKGGKLMYLGVGDVGKFNFDV